MRCRNCQYPLWDLKPGPCPECGTPFDPTLQDFKPGEVRFCCPHCDQAYYGDGPEGHLQPPAFTCVDCGTHIQESECVIRPREDRGYDHAVTVEDAPWFGDEGGFFGRFFRTIGWSMVSPIKLGRSIPLNATVFQSVGLAYLLQIIIMLFGVGPFFLMVMLAPGGPSIGSALRWGPLGLLASLLGVTIGLLISGALCHGMLRITGETRGGFGRTLSCLALGYGPWIMMAVPFVGPYCLQYPASIWGVVSSILILVGGQAVSGVRATFAVLAPVLLLILVGIALAVALVFGVATARGPVMPVVPGGFTPPSMVMMDAGAALITREEVDAMLERVQKSTTLPDASTLLGTWSKANAAKTTSFKAGRLDGWWIPGLMVLKGPEGAGILLLDSSTGSERLKVVTEKKSDTTTTGSTSMRTDGFGEEILSVVVELGGADGDLAKVADAWTAASTRQGLGESAKPEPAKTEPAKTEPAKTEPANGDPGKGEPAKTEPAKPESAETGSPG